MRLKNGGEFEGGGVPDRAGNYAGGFIFSVCCCVFFWSVLEGPFFVFLKFCEFLRAQREVIFGTFLDKI